MKARNNYSSYFDNNVEDEDLHTDEEGYTPVKNKRKNKSASASVTSTPVQRTVSAVPNAPVKSDESYLDSSTLTPTKLNFETPTVTPQKSSTSNEAPNAPKKSRRNLDALGDTVAQPNFTEQPKRDNQSVTSSRKRVYNKSVHFEREPEPEKPVEKPISLNDSELFPTLGAVTTEPKKISIWNVFNPTVLPTNQPVVIKPKVYKQVQPVVNKTSTVSSNTHYNSRDESDDNQTHSEEEYDSDEIEYEEPEEDSDVVYARELYQKRDALESQIVFVKRNYNRYNREHVKFLHQLEKDLFEVDEEILRHEDLENELDKIYHTSYYQEPSLLEQFKIKRQKEEDKRMEPIRVREFLNMLNETK